jgi:hypothetical protein
MILSPQPLSWCPRQTGEELSKTILRGVLIKAAGPANRKKLILFYFEMGLNEVPGLLLPVAWHDLLRS